MKIDIKDEVELEQSICDGCEKQKICHEKCEHCDYFYETIIFLQDEKKRGENE